MCGFEIRRTIRVSTGLYQQRAEKVDCSSVLRILRQCHFTPCNFTDDFTLVERQWRRRKNGPLRRTTGGQAATS